jgi:D-alanyl-D-alanine carboxypeptidase/D-alanyl-D-alanine-endopeptidase (penicillin-binding protein 4)
MVQGDTKKIRYREGELFIPASTIKILTCLVALENLGKDYRFETHFFLDEKKNLYIKGYGDPFLTSETILEMAGKLRGLGISQLGSLYIDNSSFALSEGTAGSENSTNPYDAPNGALAVNFNALPILVAKDGTVSSGEPQTPFIPMMAAIGAQLGPGFHRVNVNAFPHPGQKKPSLRYAGELISAQLIRSGIRIQKSFSNKTAPAILKPIYIHSGKKNLEEIVRECLKYSNNFIANQLFLACGVKDFGLPATWGKSRQSFNYFTRTVLDIPPNQLKVEEGSGLSRDNRISPAALVKVLDRFRPYSSLLTIQKNIFVKSGTLRGVFCYAGYFFENHNLAPFAILLNQPKNSRNDILKSLFAKLREDRE